MDAAARGLAAGPQVVKCGGAVEIGHDATREIVRGGGDGQPLRGRIEVGAHAREPDGREMALEVVDHRRVEPHVVFAGGDHALVDRTRDDVAGCQIGQWVHAGHERHAIAVAQDRTLAAQRLGDQRPRHQGGVERGGVELDELEISARDAGLQRERDAVTRRERRIGRHGKALTGAPRREHDVGRAHELDLVVGPQGEHSLAPAPLDQQFDREPALAHLDGVADAHRLHERAFDLGPGRVATGVHHSCERVPALARQQELGTVGRSFGVEIARRAGPARARGRAPRSRGCAPHRSRTGPHPR